MSKNIVTLLCGYELYFDVAPRILVPSMVPRHRRIEMVIQSHRVRKLTYRGKCTTCQYGMKNIDLRRVLRQAKKTCQRSRTLSTHNMTQSTDVRH